MIEKKIGLCEQYDACNLQQAIMHDHAGGGSMHGGWGAM